jgi:protein-disulfide isomerase
MSGTIRKKLAVFVFMLASLPAAAMAADTLTKQQGDAILAELKAIRALLEKQGQNAPAAAAPAAAPVQQRVTLPNAEGHAAMGAKEAPVTIIEFTDLQCPFCARFSAQTFPELQKKYIDTGKVRFVSRDLPLAFHAQAVPAAVAARCAGDQGKYWEYRERLFAAQKELGEATYGKLATEMNLDTKKFAACRASPEYKTAAEADRTAANALGITGTPTFVVGTVTNGTFTGERVTGAQPLSAFEAKIEPLLAAKKP